MDHATAHASDVATLIFEDGLGRRYTAKTGGEHDVHLEVLCFRHELTDVPSFETALRERVSRLLGFQHASYAQIRRVGRLSDGRGTLTLFSECTPGIRLATLLATVERRNLTLDINTALHLVRQLAQAAIVLHHTGQVTHGALGPERLVVTPEGRLVIVEFVLGGALEELNYSRARHWQDLRVALPPSPGLPRFDAYADVAQLGVTALSLVLGRLLRFDEYPGAIEELEASATGCSLWGDREDLTPALHSWLRRALQLDVRNSFRSVEEAELALDKLLSDGTYTADSSALTAFLARYHKPETHTVGLEAYAAEETVLKPDATEAARFAPKVLFKPDATEAAPFAPTIPFRTDATEVARFAPKVLFKPDATDAAPFAPAVRLKPNTTEAARFAPAVMKRDTTEETVEAEDWEPPQEWQPIVVPTANARQKRMFSRRASLAAGLVLTAMAGVLFAGQRYLPKPPAPVSIGTLSVETNPPGAQVTVDGEARGQAPLSLSLKPGVHTLVVLGDGEPRTVPVTIVAGTTASQYLDLPKAVATAGLLQVWTEPGGARVTVDGEPRGTTPLTLTDLTSGEHTVTLANDVGSVTHKVMIVPGIPASLVVPLGAPQSAPASGWVSVSAPVEMQLYEQSRLIGNSGIDRIMLPAGKHDIEIVNEVLGFHLTRTIQVSSGRLSPVSVDLPKGVLSVNAVPWATVLIDGESVGETPIGNLSISIGPHEVAFRNPQFDEQRRVVTVTLREPVRLSVDLTKK